MTHGSADFCELHSFTSCRELTLAELDTLVDRLETLHQVCHRRGWLTPGSSESPYALHGHSHKNDARELPSQEPLSEKVIVEARLEAAVVAEKLLSAGGWRSKQYSPLFESLRSAKSFKDLISYMASKGSQAQVEEDSDEADQHCRKLL